MVSVHTSFFSGTSEPSPPPSSVSSQPSQFRVRINLNALEKALPQYSGRIRMHSDLRHYIDTGRMSPKEIISLKGVDTAKKYLIKELPFYVKNPKHFAEQEYRFQDWLARGYIFSPGIKTLNGQSKLMNVEGNPAALMAFLPDWVNVIQSGRVKELGKVLSNFHALCRRFPESDSHISFEEKTIQSINEDLFDWCLDAFDDHCKPSEQNIDMYKALMEQVQEQTTQFKPYGVEDARFMQIVHGEFNLGNILNKGGAFKVIDFDDIQINHVAYDLCYLSAQLCVFNFASPVMNRAMPEQLQNSATFQYILKDYIRDYDPDDALVLLNRLKDDFKHHLGRGILLAFSGKHFHISELPKAFSRTLEYDRAFSQIVERMISRIELEQTSINRKTLLYRERWKLYAEKYKEQSNKTASVKSIMPAYYSEHVQAKSKVVTGTLAPVKYMTHLEAQSWRIIIQNNVIIPIGHAAKQALKAFDENQENLPVFIIAVDKNNRTYLAPKINIEGLRIQHSSFTCGKPLYFAGYIDFLKENYHITAIRCESGHYDFPTEKIDAYIHRLIQNGQLSDPDIKAKSFYGNWRTLHEF